MQENPTAPKPRLFQGAEQKQFSNHITSPGTAQGSRSCTRSALFNPGALWDCAIFLPPLDTGTLRGIRAISKQGFAHGTGAERPDIAGTSQIKFLYRHCVPRRRPMECRRNIRRLQKNGAAPQSARVEKPPKRHGSIASINRQGKTPFSTTSFPEG